MTLAIYQLAMQRVMVHHGVCHNEAMTNQEAEMVKKHGGARKGAGAKPKGSISNKSAWLSTRITPETRAALEHECRLSGRSLSQVAEDMLNLGLGDKEAWRHDLPVQALCYLIAQTVDACRGTRQFELTDPFVFRAFKLAMADLLHWLEPKGEIESLVDRLGEDFFANYMPPHIVDTYRTPEARAKHAADFIWTKLLSAEPSGDALKLARNWKNPKPSDDRPEPNWRTRDTPGARLEQMLHRMARSRRDLNIKPQGETR